MEAVISEEIKYDNQSIISRIKTKLEKANIKYEKLFEIMKNNNVYLSGSFLLQAIKNTDFYSYFDSYDLDLFVFDKSRNLPLENQKKLKNIL